MTDSRWLTAAQAAAYVQKSLKGFNHWVTAEGVPCGRAGNIRLFEQAMLDRVIRNAGMRPRRRRKTAA